MLALFRGVREKKVLFDIGGFSKVTEFGGEEAFDNDEIISFKLSISFVSILISSFKFSSSFSSSFVFSLWPCLWR